MIWWEENTDGEVVRWYSDDVVQLRMPLWQAVVLQAANLVRMARDGVPYVVIRDEIYSMLLGDQVLAWLAAEE